MQEQEQGLTQAVPEEGGQSHGPVRVEGVTEQALVGLRQVGGWGADVLGSIRTRVERLAGSRTMRGGKEAGKGIQGEGP